MSQAPSAEDQFNEQASRRLESIYLTPDIVAQRAQVMALLQPQPGERALDIGCGPGLTTRALAEAVGDTGQVLGVDIAAPMLSIARRRCDGLAQVGFELCDVNALPCADASVDLALASQVYEYVEPVDAALRELARVLKPGGRALLVDTDWESAVWASHDDARMRRVLESWNEHIPHPQLPRTLKRRMEQAGFASVTVTVVPLLNDAYDRQTYSVGMMDMIGNFVTGRNGLSAEDIALWKADAVAIGAENGYFFSLSRYVFAGVKSHSPA
jgi:ubiquinone/menaquinone biosynthesis C-methylase UbiE